MTRQEERHENHEEKNVVITNLTEFSRRLNEDRTCSNKLTSNKINFSSGFDECMGNKYGSIRKIGLDEVEFDDFVVVVGMCVIAHQLYY